jgi:hypothetical protein
MDRRQNGRTLKHGNTEAAGHLSIVRISENRIERIVATFLAERSAEVVEIHRLKRAEPADERSGLHREKTFLGGSLVDFEADRAEIWALIEGGEYVMHHSELFEQHYEPHYRIIESEIFRQEILPLIERKK